MAKAITFNRLAIESPFTKRSATIEKHSLGHEVVYNGGTSGLVTVHKPTEVVAGKGSKQHGTDICRQKSRCHRHRRNEAQTLQQKMH